ncbi:hypothetical protein GOBAR_AA27535 [Gossypium barbadense]|uniref:BURP domain-containing protein n=1 Tax=Gossypium barbadense TaxID=3634 RepID=A0A2P5WPZ0_GOSBA|nr:hypothetical protein GOBAR_AA27535 [Gossypium barbadense]
MVLFNGSNHIYTKRNYFLHDWAFHNGKCFPHISSIIHVHAVHRNANAGNGQSFSNYGKNGNDIPNDLNSYRKAAYVEGSSFSSYEEPANELRRRQQSGGQQFRKLSHQSNVGDNSFQSYTKNSNGEKVDFSNYGQSFNEGAVGQPIGFKIYGRNNTFKDYSKKDIVFGRYNYGSSSETAQVKASGSVVNKWVEPGKFFREKLLKRGTVMPMLEIRDKMPVKINFAPDYFF